MSAALTSDLGGMLTELVEAQRGLTDAEVDAFLATGELPDLAEDPVDEGDEDDEPPVMHLGEARAFLAGLPVNFVAAGGFLSPSSPHYESPTREVFKFNPGQPRDHDGKWTDTGLGAPSVPDVPKAPTKKVTPAVIYKKHADGAVVAQSADRNRRLRWVADRKKFVAEQRTGGGWEETESLTKTAAYEDTKQPDKWFESVETGINVKPAMSPETPDAPTTVVEPTAKTTTLDDLRDNPAVLAALNDPGAFKASHGGMGVPSDVILEAIAQELGFTSHPQIGTQDDIDAAIASGQPELLKAFQEDAHLVNFTDGPYYAGVGDQGNGIYASYRPPNYDVIAEIRREEYGPGPKGVPITDEQIVKAYGADELDRLPKLYQRRRAEVEGRLLTLTKTYGQHVLRGSLRPDVDVKSLKDDIYPAQREYLDELTKQLDAVTDVVETDHLTKWINVMRDPGRFAAVSGVRAYYGSSPNEIVILDRGALLIQREKVSGGGSALDVLTPEETSVVAPMKDQIDKEAGVSTSTQVTSPKTSDVPPAVVEPTVKTGPGNISSVVDSISEDETESSKLTRYANSPYAQRSDGTWVVLNTKTGEIVGNADAVTTKALNANVKSGFMTRELADTKKIVEPPPPRPSGVPFPDTDRFRKMNDQEAADMHAQMQSPKWTSAQAKALNFYASDGHKTMNPALRGDIVPDTKTKKAISDAKAGMRAMPRDTLVFRGTTYQQFGAYGVDDMRKKIGEVFHDPAFISTSTTPYQDFVKNAPMRIEIEVPKGTKAAYVAVISNNPSERELLLGPDQHLQLLEVRDTGLGSVSRFRVVPKPKNKDETEVALTDGIETPMVTPTVVEPTVKTDQPASKAASSAGALKDGAIYDYLADHVPAPTQTEQSGLKAYVTAWGSESMNRLLRGYTTNAHTGEPLSSEYLEHIAQVDAFFTRIPEITIPITVYRGLGRADNIYGPIGSLTGQTITELGYTSTSPNRATAISKALSGSGQQAIVTVRVPAGVKAVPLSLGKYNGFRDLNDDEQEVLLNHGTTYRVVSDKKTKDGKRAIVLDVIADKDGDDVAAVVAAAGVHTGAMVALVPSHTDAKRLAVGGGESVEELHLTICYLGDAALIPVEVRRFLVDCVSRWARSSPTVIGNAFAVSIFNPAQRDTVTAGAGEREPCVVAQLGGDQLKHAYDAIARDVYATLDTAGVGYPSPHAPWVPHITLRYTDETDVTEYVDRTGPVTFDAVRLAFGDDVYDVPLGDGARDVTASFDPNQPRDGDGQWTDGVGGQAAPKLGDIWSTMKDNVGKVVAETPSGENRVIIREENGKIFPENQARKSDGSWKKWRQYKSRAAFNEDVVDNKWAKWKAIPPRSVDNTSPSESVAGKQYTPNNPPGSKNWGLTEDEWVFLSDEDVPPKWESGENVIKPSEAQTFHDEVMNTQSWDDNTAAVVYDYTSTSQPINDAIRSGSSHTVDGESVRSTKKSLDGAMYDLPRDVTVFRQVHQSGFGVDNIDDLSKLIGKNFIDKAYLSTSVTQRMRGVDRLSNVHMKINVPKGTKGAYVGDVSAYPEQDELLLGRRTKLRIKKVQFHNGRAFIEADVIK